MRPKPVAEVIAELQTFPSDATCRAYDDVIEIGKPHRHRYENIGSVDAGDFEIACSCESCEKWAEERRNAPVFPEHLPELSQTRFLLGIKEDPKLDEFLHIFAGARYDQLRSWMKGALYIENRAPILVLTGPQGAGKTMLVGGIARLWTILGWTSLFDATGCNERLRQCPLICIDEGTPLNELAKLKRYSEGWVELHAPLEHPRKMGGHVRLVFNTNVPLSDEQLAAISDTALGPILHIEATEEAAKWLREHNADGKLSQRWVEGDGIARYCRAH